MERIGGILKGWPLALLCGEGVAQKTGQRFHAGQSAAQARPRKPIPTAPGLGAGPGGSCGGADGHLLKGGGGRAPVECGLVATAGHLSG